VLTDDEKQQLAFCFDRNNQLAKWIQNPSSIPKLLWPLALKLAREAGKELLYGILHPVAPEYGVSERSRKRKRKRPQYYKPS